MKTIGLTLLFVLFSTLSLSQNSLFLKIKECDSTYILDYRKIYGDYESSDKELIEVKLSERYNFDIDYIQGNFDQPNDLIINLSTEDTFYESVFVPVCIAEQIFQTSIIHIEYENYVNYLKSVRGE